MDRLTVLIKNRLVLAGAPAFEAPYAARDAIALAREVNITADADIVRLAVMMRDIGPTMRASPRDRDLILTVLRRVDVAPAARLDFIEQTWPRRASSAPGG
jgi:hypothetical protein